MDKAKCEERAFSRFEKVLRVYWDGIPVPPFCEDGEALRNTFSVRQLAYSADYYGETSEISLDPEESDDRGFRVLSSLEGPTTSLSSRIGSHYSPLVGTFRYRESETHTKSSSRQGASGPRCAEKKTVRIPLEPCEGPDDFDDDIRWTYRKYLRMTKVVELYEPLVKESAPINRESLRRIVVRATRGLNLGSKEWVVRETCCISDEYTRWITESIYYYMSINAVFRRILAPLQLKERPDRTKFSIIAPSPDERAISRALFETAKKNIEGSLMWSKETGSYFTALKVCWDARFRRIALFDLTTSSWTVDAGHFLRQIVTSMRAAFTRIRIDFYTNVEDFFFGYISNSKDVLSMDEAKLEASPFYRIFTATRMFLVNHLRTIVFDGLDLLIAFFSCNNRRGQRISRTTASKHPVLSVDLVVGENYQPRCPGFARIQFGVSELFEDLTRIVNELPRAETVVLRTLNLRNESINAVTPVELACARAALMDILDEVSSTIDELAYRYSKFSTLPVQFIAVARSGNLDDVKYHVEFIRASIREIRRVSPDIVYCGCFAINCQAVKKQFCANWESFLSRFVEELHNAAHLAITIAEEKCTRTQEVLQRVPTTVGELEEYLAEVIAATDLTEAVRTEDCQKAIAMINCMEENQIPVDNHLFFSSMTLMRWPEVLKKEVQNAEEVKRRCHPLLLAQLNALRAETRQHVKTLGTGVTELYNMFNLEICDIAAQTCDELRELVDQITHAVESIAHQEKALNVPVVDKFDDLYTLMNYFDTIEQFWTTVYRATTLREYYSSPVSSLNATKMIDNVREWRRLIHCSTRSLRSFSPLVRLGKQQELALANFECLEDLLRLITTPGLRKNHWKEIVRLLSSKLNEDVVVSAGDLTLQKLLDGGILDIMKDLSRIAYLAKSDFDAETALEEMKSTAKKTYFQMVTVNDEPVSRLIIADSCRTAILVKTEEFIRGCRQIRKKTGVSALVMKMLNEWESASEKTLDTFSETKLIEDQWGTMHTYLGSLHKVSKSGQLRSEEQIIMEKLDRAAEAYNSLNIMLSKPQSSLYMAIVQESMWELLLIVKTAMDEVRGLLGDVLEQKRVAFPRFNFLTDAQLLTFLSASNTKSFIRLLPYMYSRITNVEIDKGFVVAYSGEDGASIRMHTPVEITDQFSEKWMQTFDREVSRSLFVEMRRCYEKFSQVDLDDWVLNSCTQLTNMGLRLVHTRDMVDAIRLAGVPGLTAYRSKINSIRAELSRIMQEAELSHSDKARLSSAITYVLHTEIEVRHAIGNNITSLEELNSTVMLHTEMTDTTIMVRMLSMSFEYGFEFLGNYSFSYFTSETVEKLIATFIKGMVGRTTPIVCGDSAKESVLRFLSILFGRYIMHVECYSGLTESILRPLVRGSIEVGTILCLDGCEELQDTVRESLAGILNQANEALLREKRTPYVTLPLGPEGTPISVTVSRRFQAVLSTERKQIPHSLLLDYRPIYIPQLDYGEVIRGSLCAFGITAPTSTQSVQFAALYQQFNELDPRTFSNRGLMDVLRNVKPTDGAHVMERLCDSFVKVFLSVLQQNERLLELFRWHIENTLTLSDAEHTKMMLEEKVNLKSKMNLQDAFTRFSELASASSCCIITGPPFSGKTRLWKRYVGEKKHTVIATSLVSASEFYGVGTTPGTISRIAMRTSVTEKYFLIVEDDENTQSSLSMGWPVSSRIPGIAQHFIIGPAFCVIVAARRLHRATPRLAGQFTVFSLSTKPDWRKFLKSNLRGTTCSEVVARIIELLLPVMMERLRESGSSASVSGPASNDEVELYAAGSRCVSFYRKWQEYTQSCFVNGDEDEMSGQITEKTFSAQCGVFAVTWAMGLSLAPPDRFLVMKALRDVEKDFLDLMDSCAVTERVLPPLGSEATNILDLVSTPLGWKSFAEAAEHGINMSWSKYTSINSQSSAWTQIFPMASRASALCAIECLLDCGQSVTVSGLMGSGKSTLLQTLRQCDRWTTYLVSTNKGLDTTNIQDGMARCLSRRSDGRYAPPVGRKLVVCIDDLHLSPPVEKDLPLAGRLIAFCEKYAAINTLSLGYIPTTDIVFLGSTLPMKYSRSMASSCMDVYLPLLDGDELLSGLSQIFDAACARKRVELFPNACASFISLTHCCFIKILAGVKALDLGPLSEENSNPMTASSGKPEDFLSHRFLVALRAADFARQHMLTAAADYQVAVYTFKAVNDLYQSLLMTEAPRFVKQLREGVVRAAEECLRSCVRDEVRFDSLMNDYSEVLSDKIISADRDRVSEWIMEFEVTVDEMREDVLETMLDKKTATKNQSSLTVDTVSRANRSMLVHYSHFSSMNAPTSRAQTPIMRRTSSRLSTGNKRVRTASLNAKSGIQTRRYVSPTYQTTWLTMHSLFIYNSVQVAECHLALIGASRFGYHRLLRLVCSATRIPLALLREYRSDYTFETFKKEMRSIITFFWQNDTRVVVYVPSGLLTIAGIARQVDILIRTGDVSELFTVEELLRLVKGYQMPQLRSLRPLTLGDDAEIRRRVRRCLSFVLQVPDEVSLKRLSIDYPAVSSMTTVVMHSPETHATMLKDLSMSVVCEDEDEQPEPSFHISSTKTKLRASEVAYLVWQVYSMVARERETSVEQLIAFAGLVKKLREIRLDAMQHYARTSSILKTRGDEVVKEMNRERDEMVRTSEALEVAKERIALLLTRHQKEQDDHEQFTAEIKKQEESMKKASNTIAQWEAKIKDNQARADHALNVTIQKLRKVKTTQIRSFATTRLPEKGMLFLKALYRVLGDELPRHDKSSELWSLSMKWICRPDFVEKLAALSPQRVVDAETLLCFQQELSEVRFGSVMPYAHVISEFMLSFMECVRLRRVENLQEWAELDATKTKHLELINQAVTMYQQAENFEVKAAKTKKSIAELEKKCKDMNDTIYNLSESQRRLNRYVGLVDRFARFIHNDEHPDKCMNALSSEGDILLVASFYTLTAMDTECEALYRKLQGLLNQHGVPSTDPPEDAFKPLIFLGHGPLVDAFVCPEIPRRHRLGIYALMRRISTRWMLFGGACSNYENLLVEFLNFECTGSAILSAIDPDVKDQIIACLKNGEGVLLRDVNDQPEIDLVRLLCPLLEKLNAYREKPDNKTKISYDIFGREVEVHPKFFLICTSKALVTRETTAAQWLDVMNLFTPMERKYRFEALLLQTTPPEVKGAVEDMKNKRERLYEEMLAFIDAHRTAVDLLCLDIADIARGADNELNALETALTDVDNHDGQLLQITMHIQALRKQQLDAWSPVEATLHHSADVLRLIEKQKLCRSFDDRILDVFIGNMATLSPELQARLMPQQFSELPLDQKYFYGLVNYIDRVVRCFLAGWPYPLRGLFSLLFFAGTVHDCEEIRSKRGELFPESVELLNGAQYKALRTVLSDRGDLSISSLNSQPEASSTLTFFILKTYESSSDPLLKFIAADSQSMDFAVDARDRQLYANLIHQGSHIEQLFRSLAELDLAKVEESAAALFTSFFYAVKSTRAQGFDTDSPKSVGGSAPSTPSRSCSLTPTSVSSEQHLTNLAFADVFPEDLLTEASQYCMPLYYRSVFPSTTLKELRRRASGMKWGFQWFHIGSVEDVTHLARRMTQCFYSKPGDRKGMLLVAYADGFRFAGSPSIGSNVPRLVDLQVSEQRELARSFHRLLSLFAGGITSKVSFLGVNSSVPVCLAVVCSQESHQLLWSFPEAHSPHGLCFYSSRHFESPRQHLLDLLRSDTIIQGAKWEAAAEAKAKRLAAAHQAAMEQNETSISGSISGRKFHGSKRMIDEPSTTTVERMAVLVVKELVVIHTAMAERFLMDFQEWRYEHGDTVSIPPFGIDDDNLRNLLQILSGWITFHSEKPSADVDTSRVEVLTDHTSSDLQSHHAGGSSLLLKEQPSVFADPKATPSQDRKAHMAYLLCRNRRLAWRLHLPMSSTADGEVPSLMHIAQSVQSGSPVRGFNGGGGRAADPLASDLDNSDDEMISVLFSLFQKLSHQVFFQVEMPTTELAASEWLIDQIVVAPSATGVVSCNLTNIFPPCPLLLDAETSFKDWTMEISSNPSHLDELSCDAAAVGEHRRRMQVQVRAILFSSPTDAEAHGEVQRPSPAGTIPRELPALPSLVLEEESSRIAGDAADTQPDDPWMTSESMIAWKLEKKYVQLLINYYAVHGEWTVCHMIMRTARSLLGRNTSATASRTPAHQVALWLPCLRFPMVAGWLLAAGLRMRLLRHMRASGEPEIPSDDIDRMILVITVRRHLTPGDVVLERARLSPLLYTEVQSITGWSDDQMDSCSSSVWPGTQNRNDDEDVVVAFRAVGFPVRYAFPNPEDGPAKPSFVRMLDRKGEDDSDSSFICSPSRSYSDHEPSRAAPPLAERTVTLPSRRNPTSFMWKIPPSISYASSRGKGLQRAASTSQLKRHLPGGELGSTRRTTGKPHNDLFFTGLDVDGSVLYTDDHAPKRVSQVSTIPLPLICASKEARKEEQHPTGFVVDMSRSYGHMSFNSMRDLIPDGEASAPGSESSSRSASLQQLHAGDSTYVLHTEWRTLRELHVCLVYDAKDTSGKTPHGPDRGGTWTMGGTVNADPENREFPHKGSMGYHIYVE